MLQAFIAKRILGAVIKKVMEKREIKKLRKYVEEDNELDIKVKDLENSIAILNKHIEISDSKISELEKDSHPSQEFICCRRCGCKIAKTKSKKRRK